MFKKYSKLSAYYATKRLPFPFIERLDRLLPSDKRKKVLQSFCQLPPITFRANTLKIKTEELRQELKNLGFSTQKIPWYQDAFILLTGSQKKLMETKVYQEGKLYLQSLSSMIPVLILNPRPGEKVLDLCAAPGSKTSQMAALMKNSGELAANDINQIRIFKLKANLALLGVSNTVITQMPAEIIWRKIPEKADKTLVDVPCSMEGRFFCGDPKTYNHWSTKKVHYLAKHQKWILRSAISATKPDGIIVYSTCTLSPEENEGVIDWILKKENGALKVEPINLPGLTTDPAILEWEGQQYDPQIKNTVRILPGKTMEGFFIAKLKKIKSTVKN